MKTKFFFTFILALLLTFFVPAVSAQTPCQSQAGGHCVNLAAAGISGLEFLDVKDTSPGGVIEAVYKFGMEIVGVAALIVFVAAGIWYLTAGDNEKRVKQAQTWMGNAIFGLVLALVSYLILNTINPALVNKLKIGLEPLRWEPPKTNVHTQKAEPTPLEKLNAERSGEEVLEKTTMKSVPQFIKDNGVKPEHVSNVQAQYRREIQSLKSNCEARGGTFSQSGTIAEITLLCNKKK